VLRQFLVQQPSERCVPRRDLRFLSHLVERRLSSRIPEMLERQVPGDSKQVGPERRPLRTKAFGPANQTQKAVVRDVFRNVN